MSRIRSIHPGVASDEAYMSMSMAAKAAWPLLWTECDDHGVFEWKPIVLKARIFPADNIDFASILAEYEALDCVKMFDSDGKRYGIVRNFCTYQRPQKPSYRHPFPVDVQEYAGLKAQQSDSPTIPVLDPFHTPTGKVPLLKEEGGNRSRSSAPSLRSEAQQQDAPRFMLDKLLDALGMAVADLTPTSRLRDFSVITELIGNGLDFENQILPAIRGAMARGKSPPASWNYFVPVVRDAVALSASLKDIKPKPKPANWQRRCDDFFRSGFWGDTWGPKPDEAGCQAPAGIIATVRANHAPHTQADMGNAA